MTVALAAAAAWPVDHEWMRDCNFAYARVPAGEWLRLQVLGRNEPAVEYEGPWQTLIGCGS